MFEYKKHSMALYLQKQADAEKRGFVELLGGLARFAVPMIGQHYLYKGMAAAQKPGSAISKIPILGNTLKRLGTKTDRAYRAGEYIDPSKTNTMIADMAGPMVASTVAEPFISKFEQSFQPKPSTQAFNRPPPPSPTPQHSFPQPQQNSSFSMPSFNQPSFQPTPQPKSQSFGSMAPSHILSDYGQ